MLQELSEKEWVKTKSVFKPMNHNLAVESVLKSLTKSRILVDDLTSPHVAMTWSKARIFISGKIKENKQDITESIQKKIERDIVARKAQGFVVYLPSDTKDTGFTDDLKGVKVYPNERKYYELDASEIDVEVDPPKGYNLELIDEPLLKSNYKHVDDVIEETQSERASVQDFFEKSFGYCVRKDDEFVAWCMSEYNTDDRFEIGVATVKDYRKKGLATLASRAVIRHGASMGYRKIGWHCWARNEPSIKLALRLGFTHQLDYPVRYLEVVR
ncbi:MAG: GNAT family N-acetyltransferase [Candidatus Bathyarchaeota archaeon]|nr:GNAT family N-acetyltransferase [Candidatus Bathyarchaeota archaeon]